MSDEEFIPEEHEAAKSDHDTFTPEEVRQPGSGTTAPTDGEEGIFDKVLNLTARGAHIPFGGQTLKRVGDAANTVANAATTGGLSLLKLLASGGKENLPREDFQGTPKSPSTILEKDFNAPDYVSEPAGLLMSGEMDPSGRAMELFKMAANPLSELGQGLAKKIYASPFKQVDADIVSKWKRPPGGPTAFTDHLWNGGNPLVGGFSKHNSEIGEEIKGLRKAAGQSIGDTIAAGGGNDVKINLAPELAKNITDSMPQQKLPGDDGPMGFIQKKLQSRGILPAAKEPEVDPMNWLKNKISSDNPTDREQGLNILKQSAPSLADVIDNTSKHLMNSGDREDALKFYNGLIYDLNQGPRSLNELQDMAVSMNRKAAKNQQMGSNIFANNATPSVFKSAEAQGAGALKSNLDDVMENELNGVPVSPQQRQAYSILTKGEWPALKAIMKADSRPWVSKLDVLPGLLAAGGTGGGHGAAGLAASGVAKLIQEIQKSPRVGTGTGMLLNKLSKMGVWDRMLNRGLTNQLYQNGDNQ